MTNAPFKLIGGLILSLFALVVFLMTYFTVDPNEATVVTSFGKIDYVAGPGLHFKIPFANGTETFKTDIQEIHPDKGVNTYTVDNQEVDVQFSVFYRVPANKVEFVYTNVRDYRARLYVMAIDRLKSALGKVNVQSVAEKRGELRDVIKATLTNDAKSLGIEITDLQLTDMQYTESYRQAINAAATAKAGVEAVEYGKQQEQKKAEQAAIVAEGKANAVRADAKGKADSEVFAAEANAKATVLNAEADARAKTVLGQAEASAIEAKTKALAQNAQLVEYTKAQALLNWNGALPQNMYGSSPLPLLNLK